MNYSRRIRFTIRDTIWKKKIMETSKKRISFYIDEAYNSLEQLFIFQYVTTRKKLTLYVIYLCNECRKILFLPNVWLTYEKLVQQSTNYGSNYIAKRDFNTFYSDYNTRAWQLSKVIPERNLIKPFPICFIDAPAKDPCASHTIHHHAAWKAR